jgi:hypothetical protein
MTVVYLDSTGSGGTVRVDWSQSYVAGQSYQLKVTAPNGTTSYRMLKVLASTNPAPHITSIAPTSMSNAAKVPVVITGTNFRTGAQVYWAGAFSNVTVDSPTQITVAAPTNNLPTTTMPLYVQEPDAGGETYQLISNGVNFTVTA